MSRRVTSPIVETSGGADPRRIWVLAAVLWLAAAVVLVLQLVAIDAQSLSGDGSYHLLAGHQALRYGQNTVNLEHPPLVKLVLAIPAWLSATPLAPPVMPQEALKATERMHRQPALVRRVTLAGRVLILLLFAVPFLLACCLLGKEFGPARAGPVLALMVGLSLGVLPNLTILQTDTAAALVFVLVVVGCIRYVERPRWALAVLLGLVWGVGLSSKFSVVLLAPTIVVAALLPLVVHAELPIGRRVWRGFAHLVVLGAAAMLVLHAVYFAANRHYDSDVGREVIESYCEGRGSLIVGNRLQPVEGMLLTVERFDPYLAQWLTGLLGVRAQDAIGVYPSYAFGRVCSKGRWWYHPVVLLIKTPLSVIVAAVVLLVLGAHRRRSTLDRAQLGGGQADSGGPVGRAGSLRAWAPWVLVWTTVAIYLGMAMTSNYDLGYRHLIPVVPFLYLPVARAVSRRVLGATLLIAVLAAESIALTPVWMAATNTWWLGRYNPTRFALSAGNLEYRQSFVQLARAARRRGITHLNVVYLALSPDIVSAYLPDAHTVVPGEPVEPGWYAVNVMAQQYIPALLRDDDCYLYDRKGLHAYAEAWAPTLAAIQRGVDCGYIAGTFHLYRVPANWPASGGVSPLAPE